MPKEVKRGTGITAREVTMFDMTGATPGDIQLAKKSFRSWNDMIAEGGGIFGAVSLQAAKSAKLILEETASEGDSFLEDSPRDFAYFIDKQIRVAKGRIESGSADGAARHAFEAGVKWAQAVMKWSWEPDALAGQKFLQASASGASMRKGNFAPHTRIVLSQMRQLIEAGHSQSNAARIVADKGLGRSASANRAAWQRHNKKL